MAETKPEPQCLRFGDFEADLRAGELRKDGVKLKFGGQPFQVLGFLLERAGEVVTREELQKHLWPNTFVDVDHNLNTAINKIREALGDSAEAPRFVETLPRRGYRFIAPVEGKIGPAAQVVEEAAPAKPGRRHRRWIFGIAALAGILAAGGLAFWKRELQPVGAPRVLRFRQLTNDGHGKFGPMATDGSRIYFTERLAGAGTGIFQVAVNGGEATVLPVPLNRPALLDLSSEGTELLVGSGEPELGSSIWTVPVAGGSPRRAGSIVGHDAAFGPDGTSIVYGSGRDVWLARRDGSIPQKVLTIESLAFGFRFSPEKRSMRFAEYDPVTDSMKIMEASSQGTGLHKLADGSYGDWTADGRYFVFENRVEGRLNFWSLPETTHFRWRKRAERPTQLTSGPLDYQNPLPSKDGKTIFAIGSTRRSEVVRHDARTGEFIPFLGGISAQDVAFSRDRQWIAYVSYPDKNLWRSKADGTERLQLTFAPLSTSLPRWSPDGKQIAFMGDPPGGPSNFYLISNDGGSAQRVLPSTQDQADPNWSPDGRSLVFSGFGVANMPIYVMDLKTRQVTSLPGSVGLFSPHWSPDGRFVAAIKHDSSALMLFDFASQKWTQVFGSTLAYPIWSHDGKYIYFESLPPQGNCPILRYNMKDRRIEDVADPKKIWRIDGASEGCGWIGLDPDDAPMVTRDIGVQEIYALDMEWP